MQSCTKQGSKLQRHVQFWNDQNILQVREGNIEHLCYVYSIVTSKNEMHKNFE